MDQEKQPGGSTDKLRVVGCRADWLTVAFRVDIPPHTLDQLQARAARAAEVGSGVEWHLPNGECLALLPSRRVGWYRLESARCAAVLDVYGSGGWVLSVDLSGERMARQSLQAALETAYALAASIGDSPDAVRAARVRRLDLAVDVAGWIIRRDDSERFLTRRRATIASWTEDGAPVRTHEVERRCTGHTVCPGAAIMLRVYDKRAQLAHLDDEERTATELAIWAENGVQDGDPVARVEAQLRGDALHEFGPELASVRDNPRGLPSAVDALWQYIVCSWARMIQPGTATRRTNCLTDERWSLIQQVRFHHRADPATRTRRVGRALAAQAVGCAVSALADAQLMQRIGDAHGAPLPTTEAGAELWARHVIETIMYDVGSAHVDRLIERFGDAPDARQQAARLLLDKLRGAVALRS